MLNQLLCLLLTIALLNAVSLAQITNAEEKLKAKIVNWGLQKNVTVQLRSGERLQGRVTEIKDDFFAVQILQQGQVTTRQVAFHEIHQLSGHTDWNATKARTYISLGGAILGVVVLVVGLTRSNDRTPKTIVFTPR